MYTYICVYIYMYICTTNIYLYKRCRPSNILTCARSWSPSTRGGPDHPRLAGVISFLSRDSGLLPEKVHSNSRLQYLPASGFNSTIITLFLSTGHFWPDLRFQFFPKAKNRGEIKQNTLNPHLRQLPETSWRPTTRGWRGSSRSSRATRASCRRRSPPTAVVPCLPDVYGGTQIGSLAFSSVPPLTPLLAGLLSRTFFT